MARWLPEQDGGGRRLSAHDDAEAAVETVLPMVEESTQSQRDGQRGQLLLQHRPDAPVTVQEPWGGTRGGEGAGVSGCCDGGGWVQPLAHL